MFRIAIVGGGIGGLFAALSIKHHCGLNDIHIDIYEHAPEYREIGAGVGMGPHAAELVRKLGLLEEALKIAGTDKASGFLFVAMTQVRRFIQSGHQQKVIQHSHRCIARNSWRFSSEPLKAETRKL
jgi:2-polyprenyl-6-methoxyphenol hydroxylase-like FAD-dependent oxidoreductase